MSSNNTQRPFKSKILLEKYGEDGLNKMAIGLQRTFSGGIILNKKRGEGLPYTEGNTEGNTEVYIDK